MGLLSGLLSGLVFGIGLLVSGMTNPAKVIGFLDITGSWDMSLALVMGGALLVAGFGFFFAKKRLANHQASLSGEPISIPTSRQITPRLVIGSALFGIAWGLVGICPGPAVVMFGSFPFTGAWQAVVFTLAMLVGMFIFQLIDSK
ncbi:MAG: hypothetical protein CR966_00170 [Pseudomonadales bacterium]|nr:MAG: hypothetical protein CR966_00170 [Pseudomonadales bacterium]